MFLTWFLDVETSISRSGYITSQGISIVTGVFVEKKVLKNSLNRDAFSKGSFADLPLLAYVTTSGNLFDLDLSECNDQNVLGLFFSLSDSDLRV
jgi:hypothetical protein